jgi:hypothetical protein
VPSREQRVMRKFLKAMVAIAAMVPALALADVVN